MLHLIKMSNISSNVYKQNNNNNNKIQWFQTIKENKEYVCAG